MEICVFGAGGRVGRRLCEYAHNDGHHVTAFARDAATVPTGLTTVEGHVADADAVARALTGADAVCSAFGPEDDDTTAFADGMDTIVTAMEAAGVDRLVAVSAAAILQATPTRLRRDTADFPAHLEHVAAAHWAVYERLSASTLSWTLVCPPQMPDGAPTNHYRTAVDYLPDGGQSISTGDVAAFCFDALVSGRHVGERVGVAY
jgi:putative NADH-flavin reductase